MNTLAVLLLAFGWFGWTYETCRPLNASNVAVLVGIAVLTITTILDLNGVTGTLKVAFGAR